MGGVGGTSGAHIAWVIARKAVEGESPLSGRKGPALNANRVPVANTQILFKLRTVEENGNFNCLITQNLI